MRLAGMMWFGLCLMACGVSVNGDLLSTTGKTFMEWPTVGKVERSSVPNSEGKPIFSIVAGNNNGVWTGPGLTFTGAQKYALGFNYRLISGELHVMVKHGNDTYGALARKLIASDDKWHEFKDSFVNQVDGNHASLWFMGPGKFELSDIQLTPVTSPQENQWAKQFSAALAPAEVKITPPDLTGVKLIAQEWHHWFSAATDNHNGLWQIWNSDVPETDCFRSVGPLWRRGINDLIYPYLGPYSAENQDVIRWQIRVMKNCGLDGTMCQMYPVPGRGAFFCNEDVFATCLRIAEEENYQLGIHDEIQFMQNSAKSVDAFVERAVRTLRLADKYPRGYLLIDGMPVYQYEAFAMPWTAEEHDLMIERVEKELGRKVFWMVSGPVEKMVQVKKLACLKNPANVWPYLRKENDNNGKDDSPTQLQYEQKFVKALQDVNETVTKANVGRDRKLFVAPWVYPGFNNATWKREALRVPAVAADRELFFLKSLNAALKINPHIINLAGWNERSEKTCIEPSWNNENPDPFYLVKLIAATKKITFKEPPLPPKEAIDPMMWSILYGIDRTPPRIVGARAHVSEANLAVDCLDDLSGVDQIAISAAPLFFSRFTVRPPASFKSSCSISPSTELNAGGIKLEPKRSVTLRITLTDPLPANGDFWLGFKYRSPQNTGIRCLMQYNRVVPNERFKLNNNQISTVPKGPFLVGNGRSMWHVLPLNGVSFSGHPTISVEMTFNGSNGEEPAFLEEVVLFPGALQTEAGSFALPAASKQFRSFIVHLPGKLLPRNFFNIPLAVQCRDLQGNLSPLCIFEIDPSWQKLAPAAVSLECDTWRWFK